MLLTFCTTSVFDSPARIPWVKQVEENNKSYCTKLYDTATECRFRSLNRRSFSQIDRCSKALYSITDLLCKWIAAQPASKNRLLPVRPFELDLNQTRLGRRQPGQKSTFCDGNHTFGLVDPLCLPASDTEPIRKERSCEYSPQFDGFFRAQRCAVTPVKRVNAEVPRTAFTAVASAGGRCSRLRAS